MIKLNNKKLFTADRDTVVDVDFINKAIDLHKTKLVSGYVNNENMYMTNHDILKKERKPAYKPDNRLILNYAKYIIDTFTGFHLGIPVKISHEDESITDLIREFRETNDMLDSEFELTKQTVIFGHSYIYLYQDEEAITRMTYNNPINMFMIHDNSIAEIPVCAIRYTLGDKDGNGYGEVITNDEIISISINSVGQVSILDRVMHQFHKIPVVELVANEERQGLFDSVKTLINALNKAVSEKANDVDYFADAYLKVTGVKLEEDIALHIRDSRLINLYGETNNLDAEFLNKPNADATQENLIHLLVKSIFDISMVANLSQEDFGASSGTALAFKLQPMSNLANTLDRKVTSAFNRMYELLFNLPTNNLGDEWKRIDYKFTRNVPRNIKEEAEVLGLLDGKVSNATRLSILSIIDDVDEELDRIEEDDNKATTFTRDLLRKEQVTDDVLGK